MEQDETERIYRQLLKDSPNDARTISHLAVHMCYGRKDYEEAERLYRRAVEVAPNDAKTVCQLARFLTRTGKDAGEAEPLFRRALELDPNDARINCAFAMYLKHDRKDYDEAEQLFRRAIELAPNDAGINFSSAVFFHHARQDYAAAESFYRKAVELRPNDAYNNRQLAEFLWNVRKDLQEAEYFYRASVDLDPEDPETTDNYVSVLLENGRTTEAAAVVDRACANKGKNSQVEAIAALYRGLISRLSEAGDQDPLRYLKSLMAAGFKRYSGNVDSHVAAFSAPLPRRDQALYQALAAAILDDQKVKDLKMVERWREIESPQLDS